MARPVAAATTMATGVIAGSYAAVRLGGAAAVDRPAHRLLTEHHGPISDRVVGSFTDMGSIYALAGVATALAARGRRSASVDLAVAGGLAWVAAQAAKPLLRRPRPYELASATRTVAVPAGSSWPSGHAALAAAMTDALWPRTGPGTRTAMVVLTGAVGLSRCYVGVHHLTDVIAGAGVGVLSSRVGALLRTRVEARARSNDADAASDVTVST